MIHWKIALYWILGSVIVGMALSFMVHPDIGSILLIACICIASFCAIIHYLIVYKRTREKHLKQLTPVAVIISAFAVFFAYLYFLEASCEITEEFSYGAAEQFVKQEGYDATLLEKSGRKIWGCYFIFEYDKADTSSNKLVLVDSEGNAKFNDSQVNNKPEVDKPPDVNQ